MTTSITNHYQIYTDSIVRMAETIVIKSEETASAINSHVRLYSGSVDEYEPYSWKYYMHLSGEYHFSDKPMEVVSLDTLQMIAFTKENLVRHRATARGYQYGTRYFNELLAKYPDQRMLLIGILYPVSRMSAIDAPDGAILRILPGLLEENEYTFVQDLQRWIDGFKLRWFNRQFGVTDNLYQTASLGVMYAMLYGAISMIRKSNCKTNQAHSYHVRQYLLSRGLQDRDIDQLTLTQSLWLYRNIDYIVRHAGIATTFDTLIEHILTEREIPLADYTMRHDVSAMPENLYPELTFRRKPLNLGFSVNSLDNISLQQILDKEDEQARDNAALKEDFYPVIRSEMENSRSNVLLTKVLESTMVDYTGSEFYKIEDILLNHWLYLSTNNMYASVVLVLQPVTGERVPMKMADAYAVMHYFFCKAMGIELDIVPTLSALRVQRLKSPTVEEMMSIVEPRLVSVETANFCRDMNPVISQIISIEEFDLVCREIWRAANKQRDASAFQEHKDARAYVQAMNQRIYTDAICQLSPSKETYKQLFTRLNFQMTGLEQENYEAIWKEIVRDATGASLSTTKSVKDMQKAMLRIMKQLSSYTVQYLSEINESNIISTDFPGVRVGDSSMKTGSLIEVVDVVIGVEAGRMHSQTTMTYDINGCRGRSWAFMRNKSTAVLELPNLVHHDSSLDETLILMNAAPIDVEFQPVSPPTNGPSFPMPGIESFLAMSPESRKALQDQWNGRS